MTLQQGSVDQQTLKAQEAAVGVAKANVAAAELTLATGLSNDEFAAQVRGSHAAITAILRARNAGDASGGNAGAGDPRIARYLSSEQALVAGHRFHPAPKARSGEPADWLSYAPEAGARFPLRFIAVLGERTGWSYSATTSTRSLNTACTASRHDHSDSGK